MIIRDFNEGEVVAIHAVVVHQNGGQALLWVPGVGESGTWSIVATARCVEAPAGVAMQTLKDMSIFQWKRAGT